MDKRAASMILMAQKVPILSDERAQLLGFVARYSMNCSTNVLLLPALVGALHFKLVVMHGEWDIWFSA